jgi:hypothetical protein
MRNKYFTLTVNENQIRDLLANIKTFIARGKCATRGAYIKGKDGNGGSRREVSKSARP